MPQLIEINEYRFVEPDYIDPEGREVTEMHEQLVIEAFADAIERHAIQARDQIKLCAEVGHTGVGGCMWDGKAFDVPRCERLCKLAEGSTRTATRTKLVKIRIPIDDKDQSKDS